MPFLSDFCVFIVFYLVLYCFCVFLSSYYVFFFNDTATTEIYTLSLHDALPILSQCFAFETSGSKEEKNTRVSTSVDRKSTRLNSSHLGISYAVFCLKKKKKKKKISLNKKKSVNKINTML